MGYELFCGRSRPGEYLQIWIQKSKPYYFYDVDFLIRSFKIKYTEETLRIWIEKIPIQNCLSTKLWTWNSLFIITSLF